MDNHYWQTMNNQQQNVSTFFTFDTANQSGSFVPSQTAECEQYSGNVNSSSNVSEQHVHDQKNYSFTNNNIDVQDNNNHNAPTAVYNNPNTMNNMNNMTNMSNMYSNTSATNGVYNVSNNNQNETTNCYSNQCMNHSQSINTCTTTHNNNNNSNSNNNGNCNAFNSCTNIVPCNLTAPTPFTLLNIPNSNCNVNELQPCQSGYYPQHNNTSQSGVPAIPSLVPSSTTNAQQTPTAPHVHRQYANECTVPVYTENVDQQRRVQCPTMAAAQCEQTQYANSSQMAAPPEQMTNYNDIASLQPVHVAPALNNALQSLQFLQPEMRFNAFCQQQSINTPTISTVSSNGSLSFSSGSTPVSTPRNNNSNSNSNINSAAAAVHHSNNNLVQHSNSSEQPSNNYFPALSNNGSNLSNDNSQRGTNENAVCKDSDAKRFRCSECGKCFKQKGNLKTHFRTHTGERPFVCNVCQKSFIQSGHLKNHLLIHQGSKPYRCNVCFKQFRQCSNLKQHQKKHKMPPQSQRQHVQHSNASNQHNYQ